MGNGATMPRLSDLKPLFTRQTGRWIALAAIGLAVASLTVLLPRLAPKIFGYLEERTRDLQIATLTPAEPQGDIVIVSIREETLRKQPYLLPVDRQLLADLITHIDQAGAKAIGVDFVLDRLTTPAKDAALLHAIAEASTPVVVGWQGKERDTERLLLQTAPHGAIAQTRGLDDIVRSQITQRRDEDAPLSFPAAIATALGKPTPPEYLRIAWRGRPDSGTGAFADFPAHTAMTLPEIFFKDKVVLIGEELPFTETFATPFSSADIDAPTPPMPRVLLHAHQLNQLLEDRRLERLSTFAEIGLALVVAALGVGLAAVPLPLWTKIIGGAAITLALWAIPFAVFNQAGVFVPAVMPTIGFFAAIGLAMSYLAGHERDQRAMIRNAFSRYVPPAVVARLDRDPSRLELGGERRELTFVFTDLAGFTAMAEQTDPHVLADFMNAYLDGIASVVLEHGGTIDKFLGDGVMSFFGAPEASDDDPARAVACALAIDGFARTFATEWQAEGVAVGETRIGVHTGPAIVGNFGGRGRFHYTALGDTVNTASRIESANKHLGTRILVSGETAARAGDARLRPVGEVVLKGREQHLTLFEAAGATVESEHLDQFRAAYERAASAQHDSDPFADIVRAFPHDALARYHSARFASGERGIRFALSEK